MGDTEHGAAWPKPVSATAGRGRRWPFGALAWSLPVIVDFALDLVVLLLVVVVMFTVDAAVRVPHFL